MNTNTHGYTSFSISVFIRVLPWAVFIARRVPMGHIPDEIGFHDVPLQPVILHQTVEDLVIIANEVRTVRVVLSTVCGSRISSRNTMPTARVERLPRSIRSRCAASNTCRDVRVPAVSGRRHIDRAAKCA
jgi:hypothetical protein